MKLFTVTIVQVLGGQNRLMHIKYFGTCLPNSVPQRLWYLLSTYYVKDTELRLCRTGGQLAIIPIIPILPCHSVGLSLGGGCQARASNSQGPLYLGGPRELSSGWWEAGRSDDTPTSEPPWEPRA